MYREPIDDKTPQYRAAHIRDLDKTRRVASADPYCLRLGCPFYTSAGRCKRPDCRTQATRTATAERGTPPFSWLGAATRVSTR